MRGGWSGISSKALGIPMKNGGNLPGANQSGVDAPDSFLRTFKRSIWATIFFATLLQVLLWPDFANVFAMLVVIVAWKLIDTFILRYEVLIAHPFSCFIIIAQGLSQIFFPPVFTLLELHPVTYNLKMPFEVFTHSLLAVTIFVSAHILYRSLLKKSPAAFNWTQKQMVRIGFFSKPADMQIWMIGILGLVSMFYVYFYAPSANVEVEGAGNKFVQGLIPFTYAPFYLLIKKMFSVKPEASKKITFWLSVFTIILFIISIGRNARGAFMFGFTGLGFGYFLGLLLGVFPPRIMTRKNVLLAAVGIWIITGPLSDLATAMVMVRGERSNVDRSELISMTMEKFSDKDAIEAFKVQISEDAGTGWDERYLSNIFLSRFCNLKFSDASLELAQKLKGVDPVVTSIAIERPLAILPQPVIDMFGLSIDKKRVNSASVGDVLFERASGTGLGSFRVGHFAGVGMASFGWFYLPLLFVAIIPVFFLLDTFAIKVKTASGSKTVLGLGVLLSLTSLYQFLQFENFLNVIQFILREWIQMIILYCILLMITRVIMSVLAAKR